MSQIKTILIPGNPRAQGRPRFTTIGGYARAYDPKESRDWKAVVKDFAVQAGCKPLEGPVTLAMDVFVARPKRLLRAKDPVEAVRCTSKPDCSNYLKGVEDALNGIAYYDDSQIWRVSVRKFYHEKQGSPRTEISLEYQDAP